MDSAEAVDWESAEGAAGERETPSICWSSTTGEVARV